MSLSPRTQTLLTASAAVASLLVGCAAPPPAEIPTLRVAEDMIHDPDGSVLLHIDDLGGSIQVDDAANFGAADRFLDALMSPEGDRFAVVSTGVAHGAGWIVELEDRAPYPAAFQYGGAASLGPWSEDGEWVVFIHEGPAGERTLTVAHGRRPAATVEEASVPVRLPGHDDLAPEERIYEVLEWREGRLIFRLDGRIWSFDPGTGVSSPGGDPR